MLGVTGGALEQLVLTVPPTVPPHQLVLGASLRAPPQLDGGNDIEEEKTDRAATPDHQCGDGVPDVLGEKLQLQDKAPDRHSGTANTGPARRPGTCLYCCRWTGGSSYCGSMPGSCVKNT